MCGIGAACTGWGNVGERHQWGETEIDGRIILIIIFRKYDVLVWTAWSWLRIGTGAGTFELCNETSVSIKCVTFVAFSYRLASQEGLCP